MTIKRIVVDVELADGTTHPDITITNPAMVAWDHERAAKGWPKHKDAPTLWLTFLAWHQLCDLQLYPRTMPNPDSPKGREVSTFPSFRDVDAVQVDPHDDDDDDNDVDPTRTATVSGSALLSPSPPASAPSGSTEPATPS